ncbi:MAG: citramalate synthase [Candidatus Aenigmarchaeota archaeon]|nr:citramalate synthase [Candidatus Aenigmarchaeota archaeon]
MKIVLYDTTLRDGAQTPGVSYSPEHKILIAKKLHSLGFDYIEGGWPGASPMDTAYFQGIEEPLRSRTTAFGMTCNPDMEAEDDPQLQALIDSKAPFVTIYGKSWKLHVRDVIKTTDDKNIKSIRNSVKFIRDSKRTSFYDAEHFFDGYRDDRDYALATLKAAEEGGASTIVLCDTNGGSTPEFIYEAVKDVKSKISVPIGIHAHNDSDLATINTIYAVLAGAEHVQGTVNGEGERTGNMAFVKFLPTAKLKYGIAFELDLSKLSELSEYVASVNKFEPHPSTPYVGRNAFRHKGGSHVDAVLKNPHAYEHTDPSLVGAKRSFDDLSEQAGKAALLKKAQEFGYNKINKKDPRVKRMLRHVKKNQLFGSAQAYLMFYEFIENGEAPFEIIDYRTVLGKNREPCSSIKLQLAHQEFHEAATGNGPVNAFELVLKKALRHKHPDAEKVKIIDYKVKLPPMELGSEACVDVLITLGANSEQWTSHARGTDVVEASEKALIDGYKYWLIRHVSRTTA